MSLSRDSGPDDADRTIDDLNTGEKITFLETAEESGNDRVVMRLELAPGTVVPLHAHPNEEVFECTEGELEFLLDGRTIVLHPGSTVTAARNHVHGLRNLTQAPAVLRLVGTPGALTEYALRVKFLLSRDGYLPTGGGPPRHLLLGAVVLHRGGLYMPPLPVWLFRAVIGALAALGRWRGHEKFLLSRYPDYGRLMEALGNQTSLSAGPSGVGLGQ